MQLAFYAREDALVRYPGLNPAFGQPARYIGREFVAGEVERGPGGKERTRVPASNPATREPSVFDSETPEGQAAARHCRKLALWPANKETAEFCGVPFVAVAFSDGAWTEKPVAAPKSALKESA
jgi:hypothetical protein